MTIRLMSFNTQHCLHYITRQIDFDAFAEGMRKHNADIIGLNEMRVGHGNVYQNVELENRSG